MYNDGKAPAQAQLWEVFGMGSDCTVRIDDGYLNLRVGAIIRKDGKFLMAGNCRDPFLYSVGGRIRFGETAEEAIVREVQEETGVKLEVERLGFVHENFFRQDYRGEPNRTFYEISFYYYMKTPENFSPQCKSTTEAGAQEHLLWVSPDCSQTLYPEFFRTELFSEDNTVKHFVTDGREGA